MLVKQRLNEFDKALMGMNELWECIYAKIQGMSVEEYSKLYEIMPKRIAALLTSEDF